MQKGGWVTKVWFLFFECWVVAICSQCYRNLSATFWQSVRSRRGRFIVPAYTNAPTKWGTKIRIRWNEYVYLIMWICVFGNVRIRARWIGPYAWRCVLWGVCVCFVDIKSVLWQLCPLAKMVRLRWLCSVCLLVCRLFGYCWVQTPPYFCYCRNAHRALWQHQRLCRVAQ